MLDALKSLFENNAISEEIRAEIESAWNSKVEENKHAVTSELREEFAKKYEHDKAQMVEAIDAMVMKSYRRKLLNLPKIVNSWLNKKPSMRLQ